MTTHTTFLLGILFLMSSCEKIDIPEGTPECIIKKITAESDNCLEKVYKYSYQGEAVYLFEPDCPDAYHNLYNDSCVLICSPSGGISGNGDGKCPDFYQKATDKKLIWHK